MPSRLLEHLISVGNKSGAIRSAPHGLQELKRAIESVPFDVNAPGMSQVININNMAIGISELVKMLGSLSALGEFKNLLSLVELKGMNISDVSPERLAEVMRKNFNPEDLERVMGSATTLITSMRNFSR